MVANPKSTTIRTRDKELGKEQVFDSQDDAILALEANGGPAVLCVCV
jgi:hypothetical protein